MAPVLTELDVVMAVCVVSHTRLKDRSGIATLWAHGCSPSAELQPAEL